MAFGDGIIDAYIKGQQIGEFRRKKARENAIADAFAQNYEQGSPGMTPLTPNDDEGNPNQSIPAVAPGINFNNAIAQLYKSGYGQDAMMLQQGKEQNDISNMFKAAQIQNMGSEAPKTRQVPYGDGMVRTEEWNPQKRSWSLVAEGKKGALVNVNTAGDNAFAKQKAEEQGKIYGDALKAASGANEMTRMAEELDFLIPQVRTGFGSGTEKLVGSGMKALNMSPEKAGLMDPAKAERFDMISNRLALMSRGQDMPGQMSDKDREFLVNSTVNLGANEDANKSAVYALKAGADLKKKYAVEMDRWIKKNKNLDGFEESWQGYLATNPISTAYKPKKPGEEKPSEPTATKQKLGDIVNDAKGKKYRIIRLNADGNHDIAPI